MTDPIPVHPVADLFPMLAEDELQELADDIKQRGLLQPIVLDSRGRVLDGRNRLAACDLAGVVPNFETYDGDDPEGFALAVNTQRRNLTKGQRAMLIVEAGPFNDLSADEEALKISGAYISMARTVKKYAPALVGPVISGADQLARAYEFAKTEKDKSDGAEAQLARLRREDPDLANRVVEGDLSLRGAFAELAERQRKRADEQRDARGLLSRVVDLLAPANRTAGFVDTWAAQLGERDTELTALVKRAADAQAVLGDLIERTNG